MYYANVSPISVAEVLKARQLEQRERKRGWTEEEAALTTCTLIVRLVGLGLWRDRGTLLEEGRDRRSISAPICRTCTHFVSNLLVSSLREVESYRNLQSY